MDTMVRGKDEICVGRISMNSGFQVFFFMRGQYVKSRMTIMCHGMSYRAYVCMHCMDAQNYCASNQIARVSSYKITVKNTWVEILYKLKPFLTEDM